MSKQGPKPTPGEYELLKVLWRIKKGTVAEVRASHRALHGVELAYTTVMTLLNRLAAKGAVLVDRERQPFVYRPAFREEAVLRDRLKQFVNTVFEGRAENLVRHLVESEALSVEDLHRIEQKLKGKGRGAKP